MVPFAHQSLFFQQPPNRPGDERALERLVTPLPSDIWHKVLEYDIGRMLHVIRAASQISSTTTTTTLLDCNAILKAAPKHRFSDHIVTLCSDTVRIHLVDIGGRTYINQQWYDRAASDIVDCFKGMRSDLITLHRCKAQGKCPLQKSLCWLVKKSSLMQTAYQGVSLHCVARRSN